MNWHKKRIYFLMNVLFIIFILSCNLCDAKLTEREVMAMGGRALFMIFLLSAPMLFSAVALGLVVAILQAVTSVQEQTLGFVPKLLITFIMLFIFGPWISSSMISFTRETWLRIEIIGKTTK